MLKVGLTCKCTFSVLTVRPSGQQGSMVGILPAEWDNLLTLSLCGLLCFYIKGVSSSNFKFLNVS